MIKPLRWAGTPTGTLASVRPPMDDEFKFVLWLCLAVVVGMLILGAALSGRIWG